MGKILEWLLKKEIHILHTPSSERWDPDLRHDLDPVVVEYPNLFNVAVIGIPTLLLGGGIVLYSLLSK